MLVIEREIGESIKVGEGIKITILKLRPKSGKVIIGVTAPKNVVIERDDIKHSREIESL
jgi:carbon storage regulator CsrA